MASGPDNSDTSAGGPPADPGSDRCSNCGVSLATDQRYCVNCGERRGNPRFTMPSAGGPLPIAATAGAPASGVGVPAAAPPRGRPWFSPGTTLVAGVATLLLAMGVGVLIGENGASSTGQRAADANPVIKVNYGAGGGASAASPSTPASTGARNNTGKHARHASTSSSSTSSATKVIHLTKKVDSQIKSAVKNVVGTNANLVAPTTQIGGKCQNGQAGCQNGKFTGNFFGGG